MIRKQNEQNRELNQYEQTQNRENVVENNKSGKLFEVAGTNKINVNDLSFQGIQNKSLEDYTGGFETIVSMLIAEI